MINLKTVVKITGAIAGILYVAKSAFYAGIMVGEGHVINDLNTLVERGNQNQNAPELIVAYTSIVTSKNNEKLPFGMVQMIEPKNEGLQWLESEVTKRYIKQSNNEKSKLFKINKLHSDYVHQASLRQFFTWQDPKNMASTIFFSIDGIELDRDIMMDTASKFGCYVRYNEKTHEYIFDGTLDNAKQMIQDFWTQYNMLALDQGKPCIPVGYYTPDKMGWNV